MYPVLTLLDVHDLLLLNLLEVSLFSKK